MSVYQPLFRTLNHVHFSNKEPSAEPATFHLFPQLPAEVRLKIWKTALCTGRRLLTVRLNSDDGDEAGYSVSVDRKPRTNPVWSTCQESRQACYEYFRLPFCVHKSSTLWVNPESDHIFIAEFNIGPLVFLNFISHLKTADPRGIGLLHIAIDSLCAETLAFLRALPATENNSQEAVNTFKEWILGLQSIWFIHLLSGDSRLGFGPLSGTRNHTIIGLNRAMPIFPYATDFELFTPDPRPIKTRLNGQTVWYDPKRAVSAWVAMEKRLGFGSQEGSKGDEEPTREISHVLAMGGEGSRSRVVPCNVNNLETMDECLQSEQDRFHKAFFDGPFQSFQSMILQETEEQKKSLLSAAGFWVFPRGTFDTLDASLPGKAYQNLRGQQPGLGLFDLENDGGD